MTTEATQQAKHTPGPWFLVNGNEIHDRETKYNEQGARVGDTPNIIAKIEYVPTWVPEGASIIEANGQLIAAAPEMLEALECVNRTLNTHFGITDADEAGDETHDAVRAALQKAKGG